MSLKLEWNSELEHEEIPESWIELLDRILQKAGEMEEIASGEVALTFVDDGRIQELNKQYRNIDAPTDVLSFAMWEGVEGEPEILFEEGEDPSGLLGDIVISLPRARAQSEEYGHSLEREVGFLFVHGFLHLIGYDHMDEETEKAMFSRQEEILQEVGLTR